jgi:hypothetical protein
MSVSSSPPPLPLQVHLPTVTATTTTATAIAAALSREEKLERARRLAGERQSQHSLVGQVGLHPGASVGGGGNALQTDAAASSGVAAAAATLPPTSAAALEGATLTAQINQARMVQHEAQARLLAGEAAKPVVRQVLPSQVEIEADSVDAEEVGVNSSVLHPNCRFVSSLVGRNMHDLTHRGPRVRMFHQHTFVYRVCDSYIAAIRQLK